MLQDPMDDEPGEDQVDEQVRFLRSMGFSYGPCCPR